MATTCETSVVISDENLLLNQTMMASEILKMDDFISSCMNPWFNGFHISKHTPSMKSCQPTQALEYKIANLRF